MLHHLEVDDSCHKRRGRLVLFVQRLDLEERSERVLLLTLVELLVQRELLLAGEDALRELKRLVAVNSLTSERSQIGGSVCVQLC